MRRLLLALVPLFIASQADAQINRRGARADPPTAWISGGAAYTRGWSVADGTTGSRWDFGNATQYQLSLEKAMAGATIGLRGTTALAPLRYNGVDAEANVSQLFAAVHVAPGNAGFHSVLELDAGATRYSRFRERSSGNQLAPTSDTDFTFAFGYGFGYNFSNRFGVEVVQNLETALHQHQGLSASDDTSARINSTRIVGRLGLGG